MSNFMRLIFIYQVLVVTLQTPLQKKNQRIVLIVLICLTSAHSVTRIFFLSLQFIFQIYNKNSTLSKWFSLGAKKKLSRV